MVPRAVLCIEGPSSAPVSPWCVLDAGVGLGRATVALFCSEGNMLGRQGRNWRYSSVEKV